MIRNLTIALTILVASSLLHLYPISQSSFDVQRLEKDLTAYLADKAKSVVHNRVIDLLAKDTISQKDLRALRSFQRSHEEQKLHLELYIQDSLVLWTNSFSERGFCNKIDPYKDITGTICLDPWNSEGESSIDFHKKVNFNNHFKLDHTSPTKIFGVPVVISRPYNSPLRHKSIHLLLFIAFGLLSLTAIKYNSYLPLIIFAGLRTIMLLAGWSHHYYDESIINSLPHLQYCSSDFLLDAIGAFGIITLFSRSKIFEPGINYSLIFKLLMAFLHVLLLFINARLVQLTIGAEHFAFDIEDLSKTSLSQVSIFLALILNQVSLFHIGNKFLKLTKSQSDSTYEHYFIQGAAIVAGTFLSYTIGLDLNATLVFLFLFTYFLLLDLYLDVSKKSLTWVIWWSIFISVFLSGLFYNYDIKRELHQRFSFLKNTYHNASEDEVNKIYPPDFIDELVDAIRETQTLSDEEIYDTQDLETYIKAKFSLPEISLTLKNTQILTDPKFSFTQVLNDSTYYHEFDNQVIYDKTLDQDTYLKIKLPINRLAESETYAYNYYSNGQKLVNQIDISQDDLDRIIASDKIITFSKSNAFVAYRPNQEKLIITIKSFSGLVKPITLFSYVFSLLIALLLGIVILDIIYPFLTHQWPFKTNNTSTLNGKIQVTLIAVIFLSFLIIAALTNSFLKNYITRENIADLESKLEILKREIDNKTNIAVSGTEALAILDNYKETIQHIHGVDMEVSSLESSNADFFPHLFYTKHRNTSIFTDHSESKSASYIPVLFRTEVAGYTKIHLIDNPKRHTLNIFDFLGSIFNVYVFLFLIASVISIFIAQSITRPLSLLNQKMTRFKLGKQNETIKWNRDDEIGKLIHNYNIMVGQVEESAKVLAKTERDTAWREMAKQVAHEIKNPLTPMKLSIQYLEKAIKQKPDQAVPITKKISNTILEQIENLTGIADAFGNFAELPKSINVKIELNTIVEVVHNLFRKRDDMDIKLTVPIDPIYVFGDKNQLIRILNNLVKNATESIPSDRKGQIHITLFTKADKAIINVKDNGCGIPMDMHDKVFRPKFTTKDSGSGLGLAISANMIESMNGRIFFDSILDKSTTFTLEFMAVRQKIENSQNKISLD